MRSLPLKYKLILAPAVIIIPVIFVIFMTLYYINIIGQQNDTIRNWANTTDQIQIAISSSKQLDEIIAKLPYTQATENEDLIFNYIEQSRLLAESISSPILRDKIQKHTLEQLILTSKNLKFSEKIDIPLITANISKLIPELEYLYNSLQAQKRAMYIDSNEYIKNKTSSLASITVSVLAACVLLGIILSLWITRSTTLKIKTLARNANLVCDLSSQDDMKNKKYDDLEDIALCLSIISNRMLNTIAAEKLLHSVEDERCRIAMDIHDQFLSDLNIFKRNLNQKFDMLKPVVLEQSDINEINSTFDDLAFTLRGIIDDLHPQTLNMFGLEAAIQSYLDRKLSSSEHPEYYINIERPADKSLSLFQKLNIYRILLESIQNIIRHAHCSRYEIDLRLTDDYLMLTIDDNGLGFKLDEQTRKQGHGIFNITQRAYAINAEIQWKSSRFSSGTQLLLKLPLHYLKDLNETKTLPADFKASPYASAI
jgi:signal transduction histidine kinase